MSYQLGLIGGLRTWRQADIEFREQCIRTITSALDRTMRDHNAAWRFERIEAPLLMPISDLNLAYDSSDVFMVENLMGGVHWALRPETTRGSYDAAVKLLKDGEVKPPFCIWQAGPSFRVEASDGATAAKLRFNQFWQLEYQMIYSADTKLDIPEIARQVAEFQIGELVGQEPRTIASDRLPSYSEETIDIEVIYPRAIANDGGYKEVSSTSRRTDFPQTSWGKPLKVFEIAIGLDRLVAVKRGQP